MDVFLAILRNRAILALGIAGTWTLLANTVLAPDPLPRREVKNYNPYAPGNAQGVMLPQRKAIGKWGADPEAVPTPDRFGRETPEPSDWGGE